MTNQMRSRGWKDVVSGMFAGVTGTILGYPLDTVKVRMQTRPRGFYKGIIDCLYTVIKNEGIQSVFRGVGSPLVSLTFLNAFSFGLYGQIKESIRNFKTSKKMSTIDYFTAGAGVGLLSTFVTTPFELIKVQMQSGLEFTSAFRCMVHLWKYDGVVGLYRGFYINTIREVSFCGMYFGVYEYLKTNLSDYMGGTTVLTTLLSGGAAGLLACLTGYPLDVIKSNIQGQDVTVPIGKRLTFSSATMMRWNEGGLSALFSGISPSLIRAFLVSGTRFSAFEYAWNLLTRLEQKKWSH